MILDQLVAQPTDYLDSGATWREQCARLTRKLAAACAVGVVVEKSGDTDSCETRRLARELVVECRAGVTAEKFVDASRVATCLEKCARLVRELDAECSADVVVAVCGDSPTRKLLKKAFATFAAEEFGDTTRGATWSEQSTRLARLVGYANVACLVAEAFGDGPATEAAHAVYCDADAALKQLQEEHLPEIEANYDQLWAALDAGREAELMSALCSTANARSRSRRPAQARSRARRPRRARPRRPSASADGDGEGPGSRRERGATCQTNATHGCPLGTRGEEGTPAAIEDTIESIVLGAVDRVATILTPRIDDPDWGPAATMLWGAASEIVDMIAIGDPLVRRDARQLISDADLLRDRELVGEAVLVATADFGYDVCDRDLDEGGRQRRRGRVVTVGAIRNGSLIVATSTTDGRAHDQREQL